MSVTFTAGHEDTELNLNNSNAADLLRWLGIPVTDDLCGELPASKLSAICQRRLWDESRNHDAERPEVDHSIPGHARCIEFGRRPDYLRERTEQLFNLCQANPHVIIHWY